ncbi:hypothetical protein HK100_008688 [Physocladia obscura]|uniref:Cation-transporting P-type ATPase C-terminal domain-containing protein n=1 Tax=Physocladia obscura TaxID=109957 RepID=A0AAD5T4Z1_9FUNG|nr:hypothetical protein HK100_008688 [Physocladia obscura]
MLSQERTARLLKLARAEMQTHEQRPRWTGVRWSTAGWTAEGAVNSGSSGDGSNDDDDEEDGNSGNGGNWNVNGNGNAIVGVGVGAGGIERQLRIIVCVVAALAVSLAASAGVSGSWSAVARDAVAVLVFLVVALFVAAVLVARERRLTRFELRDRLCGVLDGIESASASVDTPVSIPAKSSPFSSTLPTNISSVSAVRVLDHDGITVRSSSINLLLEGDIIQLAFGDKSPARVTYCGGVGSPFDSRLAVTLEKGQLFKPDAFNCDIGTLQSESRRNRGQFCFKLLETPIQQSIKSILNSKRPDSVIHHQLLVITTTLTSSVIWFALAAALIINIFRYAFTAVTSTKRTTEAVEILISLPLFAILPLLPLSFPIICLIARSYGNAQIVCLHDALQASKEDFKDEENIDDFDPAPSPTKEVITNYYAVWEEFKRQFLNDFDPFERVPVFFGNQSATVICAVDREGTVSMPFPTVDSLFFLNAADEDEAVDPISPIALEPMSAISLPASTLAAEPVILDLKEEITAPFGLRFEDSYWKSYMDSLKPLGLSLLLSTNCTNHSSNGVHSKIRTDNHRKPNVFCIDGRVKPARQTCLCRIGREIGFQDSMINSFSSVTAVHWYSPRIDTLLAQNHQHHQQNQSHGGYQKQTKDYHFEVPSSNSQIFLEVNSGECQLFSDGNVELIVESCVDYWDGHGLELMSDAIEKKIFEFYQNAVCNDMQVIAYSYRPIPSTNAAKTLTSNSESYVERTASIGIFPPTTPLPPSAQQQQEDDQLRSEVSQSARWRNTPRKIASVIDGPNYADDLDPDAYLREVLKCQTFLGMAALVYEPKQDVSNVIEDLKLAGIRFVYFSEAPERESKAYAERLDGSPGYLELHDMKAQLPRGVENIRNHIRTVDDVPLRVSLFAESSPPSIVEMIKILQENGEVVICLGSSLNESNVAAFGTADLAIAVDPFVALKTRRLNTDVLAPLVVGAGITTSPCALRFYFDTSIYSLTQLIREARTIVVNAQQGFSFHFGCQMSLSGVILLSYLFLLPPILTGYQILWLLWVIIPIQSGAFLFTPYDPEAMTVMPVKNNDHLKDKWRTTRYYVARFAIPTIVTVIIFILSLYHFLGNPTDLKQVFGWFGTVSWTQLTDAEYAALLFSQNIALFYFVLIILQILFAGLSLGLAPVFPVATLTGLPWYIIFIVCLSIFVNIPVQEIVKGYDRKNWVRSQKLAQLQFNTKLVS